MIDVKRVFFRLLIAFSAALVALFFVKTFFFEFCNVTTGSMEVTLLVGDRLLIDKFSHNFKLKRGAVITFVDPEFEYADNSLLSFVQRNFLLGLGRPNVFCKRVIGLPGDFIYGVLDQGEPKIFVNGVLLKEKYLNTFPLLNIWVCDPTKAAEIVSKVSKKDAFRLMRHFVKGRSYDISKPLNKQPFYQINPKSIVRLDDGAPSMTFPKIPLMNVLMGQPLVCPFWEGSDVFCIKLKSDEYWVMGDNRCGSYDSRAWGPVKKKFIVGTAVGIMWSADTDMHSWFWSLLNDPIKFLQSIRLSRTFSRIC
ncbi:MAG: Signal peptidase I LepB [candidate division TM6 bacterium GW2011_GWF2_32_72]|nr:MAG: Signal peptidase I LepB [candidate division TM6 bacterium GW2011_GWF2_32_72]